MDARKCGLRRAPQRERKTSGLVLKESVNRNVLRLYSCACRVSCATSTCATVLPGRERGPEPGCRCCLVAFRPPVLYWEDVCCGLERWTHRWMMHTRLGTRLTAQAAPRWHGSWHGVAHPAATLQALCPTAGLGCCVNTRRGGRISRGGKPGGSERIRSSRHARSCRSSEGRAP